MPVNQAITLCTLKRDADLCMRLDLRLNGKTVENQDCTGPLGLQAAGPSRAADRGPPGRGGPWAAGRWAFGPPGRWAVTDREPQAAGPRACF